MFFSYQADLDSVFCFTHCYYLFSKESEKILNLLMHSVWIRCGYFSSF